MSDFSAADNAYFEEITTTTTAAAGTLPTAAAATERTTAGNDAPSQDRTRRDPKTIWKSPLRESFSKTGIKMHTEFTSAFTKLTQESNTASQDQDTVVKSLVVRIRKWWGEHATDFTDFWKSLTVESRENFLWCAYPTLSYSLTDRYSFENGKKVYDGRYDRYLLLSSHMTVSNLSDLEAAGSLLKMMQESSDPTYLMGQASKLTVNLRTCHIKDKKYPFSAAEKEKYRRELDLKKGDIIICNHNEFGMHMRVKQPHDIIHGAGTKLPDGSTLSLYKWGMFVHPIEYKEIVENLYFQLSLLANCIDECREEILGRKQSDILIRESSCCTMCNIDPETFGKKLLKCSNCMITFYCSKECQAAHWKAHKKICREFCAKCEGHGL